ncbi:hypothetical protein Ahy_A01g003280 isoform H [Arachis hypogaea]|uniref:Uncharacterized protein n=1 Tax=Arachis hypogaea TaxID=3818 RepID=A0A445ESY8_ARAHY|nr:hypothetical protein Ahy_A01g003280 isoform H [Arachis hypogaea]
MTTFLVFLLLFSFHSSSTLSVSSSDGTDEDEIQHHNLRPHHYFEFSSSKPWNGGANNNNNNNNVMGATVVIPPATSVHELLECPVCTNSMYPPIHQFLKTLVNESEEYCGCSLLVKLKKVLCTQLYFVVVSDVSLGGCTIGVPLVDKSLEILGVWCWKRWLNHSSYLASTTPLDIQKYFHTTAS